MRQRASRPREDADAADSIAEQASRVKEDFLAMVSHELRTPLAPMLMWMKVLRTAEGDVALRNRALDMLELSLKAQMKLIDDLVDLTRSRTGKLHIDQQPLDLVPLVRAAVAAMMPLAAQKQVDLQTVIERSSCRISGDSARLQQIVTNLLSNAIKFTPARGRVAVSIAQRDGTVVLTVADDGEGIEAALIPHLFDPFREHDGWPAPPHAGMGLGLAIVRQLVQLHGGTIAASSPGRGQGATFTVTFPELAAGVAQAAAPPADADPAPVLAGLRVLIVEDEMNTREALALMLELFGAEVKTAASAGAARAAMERFPAGVVLCDIGLPGEDGYHFVRQLRSREAAAGLPRLPVLALTAHATPEHRRLALEAGFDLYLTKPFDTDLLVSNLVAVRTRADIPARL